MIPMNPRHALILAAISLGLAASPLHAAPAGLDRALDAARSAGFSVPESYLPVTVSTPPAVPVPPQQRQAGGGRTVKENEDFQWKMDFLSLETEDRAFCDGRVGTENPKNKAEYRACRITRNFLAVIRFDPEAIKGLFPDLADIKYCRTAAERKVLLAWLEDASK